MKKVILLSVVFAIFLTVFGVFPSSAESILTGEYELISMSYAGSEMNPASMGISALLTLNENGTGSLIMNGAENELPKWTDDGTTVTLYNTGGDAVPCSYADGIITLEMSENYYWYFYHESVNPNAGKAASMLSKVFDEIDPVAGAHLSYEHHSDYMDYTVIHEVNAKGSSYSSLETSRVSGLNHESVSATCFLNDTLYSIKPAEKQGKVVMSISLSMLNNNTLMLDDCYKLMRGNTLRKDYTVEEREVNGKKYTTEVFPASGNTAEAAFYFDETGKLVYILEGAPVLMPDLGEKFYTIYSFDDNIDTSLFDLSEYTIE